MSNSGSEAAFQEQFTAVLDHFEIEYEEEKAIPPPDTPGGEARIDVHIPKTDAAIELKAGAIEIDEPADRAQRETPLLR